MSHTNSTSHYSLPQFVTTDKPAWLTDVNNAYTAIDTAIYNAKSAADSAQSDATAAGTTATAAGTAAATADAKGAGAVASLADAFLSSDTYSVGDLVTYNNLLYICTTAVATPGDWTGSANWTRTNVEDIVPASAADLPYSAGVSTQDKIASLDKHLTYDVIHNFSLNNDTWTATVDGTLIVTATASTTSASYVYLNGLSVTLGSIVCPSGAGGYSYGFSIPCIKNQTYRLLMGGFTSATVIVVYGTTA